MNKPARRSSLEPTPAAIRYYCDSHARCRRLSSGTGTCCSRPLVSGNVGNVEMSPIEHGLECPTSCEVRVANWRDWTFEQ